MGLAHVQIAQRQPAHIVQEERPVRMEEHTFPCDIDLGGKHMPKGLAQKNEYTRTAS